MRAATGILRSRACPMQSQNTFERGLSFVMAASGQVELGEAANLQEQIAVLALEIAWLVFSL